MQPSARRRPPEGLHGAKNGLYRPDAAKSFEGRTPMQPIEIKEHSLRGWSDYGSQIGFVPDPMVLRTGQIFLNGLSGAVDLANKDTVVWNVLSENLTGLLDFFDILVTRDTIPLINYYETFNSLTNAPLEQILPNFVRPVFIHHQVYDDVKKGALTALDQVDMARLERFGQDIIQEMDAFRYEWEPDFGVRGDDHELKAISDKFRAAKPATQRTAQFLLGSFIFGGYAQASNSTHYVQSKRSRFFLGLVTPPAGSVGFSNTDEDAIFEAGEAKLKEAQVAIRRIQPIPPVLPYLLAKGDPRNVRELLDRALEFRGSAEGRIYRKVVEDIRADGQQARDAELAVKQERENAIAFLAPDSKLAEERSQSLEINLSAKTVGIPLVEAKAEVPLRLKISPRLRLWWNDHIPFGGMRKVLRRMWLANESYRNISDKLRQVWTKS
jgi:hypothetical protein